MDLRSWLEAKNQALRVLEDHRRLNRVDRDIIRVLDAINRHPDYFTTSSCSGRIQVVEAEILTLRRGFRSLGKWHEPPDPDEVVKVVLEGVRSGARNLWLTVQPPIIHVASRTIESARLLLDVARESGFKHSGLISLRYNLVEVNASERADIPLVIDGVQIVTGSDKLVRVSYLTTRLLSRVKEKLRRLEWEFRSGRLRPPGL